MKKKGLGIDNAMDGVRLRYDGVQGFLKGFIEKVEPILHTVMRYLGGVDGEVNINDVFKFNKKTKQFLSKFC